MKNYLMNSIAGSLQNFTRYCPEDLIPGATLVYDGRHWRIGKVECCEGNGGSNSESPKIKELENTIKTLEAKIRTLENGNISEEKWIDVVFSGEKEKTVSDTFITDSSVVDFVFLNGTPTSDIITSVSNGSVTVSFEEAQTGTIRLQITKKR